MSIKHSLFPVMASLLLFSCVSSKSYKTLEAKNAELNTAFAKLQGDLKLCNDQNSEAARKQASLEGEISSLQKENAFLKENNTTVLNQLKDLSVISGTQAESVKKSLENLGAKDLYIQDLQSAMARKDSLNMALVMNLKGALNDVNDKDIEVKVEKGVVFISISDKMLFKSGSYVVTDEAGTVLAKVAQVLNAQPNIEFMVEGHTDNIPIKNACVKDNWDLSVLRATAVTRILENTYKIDPARITAGGRSEFISVASNDSPEGRMANRRTRIVIQPQLDQFFKLLEKKQ